jgi:fimbrial chaperone protein
MRFSLLKTAITSLFLFFHGVILINAGSFTTVPAKIYLSNDKKSEVLKVTNDGEEKLTLQMNAVKWVQDEMGNDRFEETGDIVFFPRIMVLEKGEEKTIRIGFETGKAIEVEKTYRLFVRELPVVKPGEKVLKVTLRLSIPVFISPKKKEKKIAFESIEISGRKLFVWLSNSGNAHVLIEKINSSGLDESGAVAFQKETPGWYVLAGMKKAFIIELSEEECKKTRELRVSIKTEDLGEMESTAKVDGLNCEKAPESVGKGSLEGKSD